MNVLHEIKDIIESATCLFSAKPVLIERFGESKVQSVCMDMPVPWHTIVEHDSKKILIVHKSHVDKPELLAKNEIAIGYMN